MGTIGHRSVSFDEIDSFGPFRSIVFESRAVRCLGDNEIKMKNDKTSIGKDTKRCLTLEQIFNQNSHRSYCSWTTSTISSSIIIIVLNVRMPHSYVLLCATSSGEIFITNNDFSFLRHIWYFNQPCAFNLIEERWYFCCLKWVAFKKITYKYVAITAHSWYLPYIYGQMLIFSPRIENDLLHSPLKRSVHKKRVCLSVWALGQDLRDHP